MPVFWLAAHDGSSIFQCEAPDIPRAFELLARSLRYDSFAAFTAETGRTSSDFQAAEVRVESAVYDEAGNRRLIEQQEDNAVVGAFKRLLRRG